MSRYRTRLHYLIFLVGILLVGSARSHGQAQRAAAVIVQTDGLSAIDRGLVGTASGPVVRSNPTTEPTLAVQGAPVERVGASGARYVPGRVMVKFRDGLSTASRVSALAAVSRTAAMSPRSNHADYDIVTIDPTEDAEAAAQAFRQRADVEYAQPAYRVYAYSFPADAPNDPLFQQLQWNFSLIDIQKAWAIQPGASSSIVVAVLDTGIAYQDLTLQVSNVPEFTLGGVIYPALGNITVPFARATDLAAHGSSGDVRFVKPQDLIWNGLLPPIDMVGHGTHVSGTIGQLTNNGLGVAGVAFNVSLMPVKVIDGNWDDLFGAPNQGTDDTVAQGIRYAADNGANVINMSIGRTGPSNCGTSPNTDGCAPAVEAAIRYAVCTGTPSATCSGKGVFIAIAGGNDFETCSPTCNPTEVLAEIASRVPGAVSVAAVGPDSQRAYYSSTGSWVEIAAPGGSYRAFQSAGEVYQQTFDCNVFEDLDGLCAPPPPPASFGAPRFDAVAVEPLQGTSMATPHVAGLAALLMQQGIKDPAAIEAAMEKFATDLGPPGRDDQFGFGLIEARTTLRGLGLAK